MQEAAYPEEEASLGEESASWGAAALETVSCPIVPPS